MSSIKNLSKVLNLKVEGTEKVLTIDFSDKRLVNRVLHLMKKYRGIDDKVNEKIKEISKIEDELDREIAFSDFYIEFLEEIKNDVNTAFNTNIVDTLYGDALVGVERYKELFELVTPYIENTAKEESEAIDLINKEYNLK